ncbi:MAG: flagellar biosynthesis protein FlhA [Firmicutes bacterium]|nr:flagellar biosynthesis protein FlhA [Bacillota bacterium]
MASVFAPSKGGGLIQKITGLSDLGVVVVVVMIVLMMVLPIPPALLDVLLAVNISLSLLLLLLTMNIHDALELSIFPSLLLLATLFRLALSVSSTRLILLHADAGNIVRAFGDFVVGGNYVVGFVIFLILVVIQFVVITKGAERVAEVAARFTLDAMPGKQMSIDADLNAGLIDENQARQRRRKIEQEADFYGAMDGATKFIKGDAIAGIIIVFIDFIGGIIVGVAQQGFSFADALQTYTLLTVGDGLVSQIPALLISAGTGIIVTRAGADASLGTELNEQLFADSKVLLTTAAVLGLLGVVPGLPTLPFMVVGAIFGAIGYALSGVKEQSAELQEQEREAQEIEASKAPENVLAYLQVDRIELEIGYSLIALVDQEQGGDLLDRVTMIRRQLVLELGLVVPPVRIRDNMQLKPGEYVIKIKGVQMAKGELLLNHYLAMDSGAVTREIEGVQTREPAFGLPALWITEEKREQAELAGYTVVDAPSVLATHLTEIIKANAAELLGRQETKALLDHMRTDYQAVVEELVPGMLSLGDVQRVLQNLLREGVSIRNLVTILETLADYGEMTKDPDDLTELVREALGREISQQFADESGVLYAITIDPIVEREIAAALEHTDRGTFINLDPRVAGSLLNEVAMVWQQAAETGLEPVVLCSPQTRLPFRRLTERSLPLLPVLSFNEISPEIEIQSVGMVNISNAD